LNFNRINPVEATLIQNKSPGKTRELDSRGDYRAARYTRQGIEATEVQIYQSDLLDTVAPLC
jgi:hypothetical protein